MARSILPALRARTAKAVLTIAIIVGIFGAAMMKASQGFTVMPAVVMFVVAYTITYTLFIWVLKTIPMGVAYALWSGIGIVATAVIGAVAWGETVNILIIVGIAVIALGVVLLNAATTDATG